MKLVKIIAVITSLILCVGLYGCSQKDGDGDKQKERVINSPYAYSVNSKILHHSSCYHVKRISDANLVEYSGDPENLTSSGFSLCKTCFPNSVDKDEPENDDNQISEEEATYVINVDSGKFHKKDCIYAINTSDSNKKYTDLTKEELISENYQPCGTCLKENTDK